MLSTGAVTEPAIEANADTDGVPRTVEASAPRGPERTFHRDHCVDLVRGLALCMIFINHIPGNWLGHWTSKNFGFSDAAELFVLLAGFAAAMAFGRYAVSGDTRTLLFKAYRRAGVLYVAHIVTTTAAIMLFGVYLASIDDAPAHDLIGIEPILRAPLESVFAVSTGGFQLSYFNILPLYVVLLLMLPAMLWMASRSLWLLAAASAACYAATSVGGLTLPSTNEDEGWFFNPLAWQALFAIGLALGLMRTRGTTIPYSPSLYIGCLAYCLFAAAWTIGQWGGEIGRGVLPEWIGSLQKSHLPLPRLLHVLALAYVVGFSPLWRWLAKMPSSFMLTRMGRNSLPVFMAGSLLSMSGWIALQQLPLGPMFEALIVAAGLVLMATLAHWLEWEHSASPRSVKALPAAESRYGAAALGQAA